MILAWRLALMVVATALVAVGCGTASAAASTGASAKSSRAARITAIVKRSVVVPSQVNGVVYGVWQHGRRIVTGALGKAQAGVAARPNMHVRIGNTAESMLATMLLRFVDQGKLSLSDKLSKWYPNLPNADKITLQMLADSTTGYNDFVTTGSWINELHADPFRQFRVPELVAIAMSKPPLFEPGTNWAFSDTNFLLLGQVLQKVGRKPIEELQREQIFKPAGLTRTAATRSTAIPPPVLHASTNERGPYEESTYWTGSWIPVSPTSPLPRATWANGEGRWARARSSPRRRAPSGWPRTPPASGRDAAHVLHLRHRRVEKVGGQQPAGPRLHRNRGLQPQARPLGRHLHHAGATGRHRRGLRHRNLRPLATYLTPNDVPPLSALPRGQSGNR